ncbi:hypothetical protein [Vreelandella boliviensis]|uniref:Lipopolysaccharide biosynthesis protein n=1 Tax=Vreelandella boliviensis LC1 TaxID=1072583 RepID=A0A265DXH2_9GAMM|nr:hypothetical protein [Halomonas boliviensis]EHJ93085.1 hypothetical protein KUC_0029 [Halomonas boliviensis LC1]OZT73698.1 hypothetical protein CE457_11930 [Halomonas boliviensis LC1]
MEQPQRSTYQDDEISLVDLAIILIRRRWWLIGTAGVIILLTLAFALLTHGDPEYQYTSIYQQTEAEPGRPLTSSASVIQQMESLDWPNYQRRYKEENKVEILPFDLEINNPDNTTLVTLNSTATVKNRDQVLNLHETLLGSVIERQQQVLERKQSQLERSIERTSTQLERVENTDSEASIELAANYADRLFQLERELENLTEGEVIEYAARGEEVEGISSIMILVLGIVLGGIAGIMMAFFVEFVCRVRESLAAESK